MPNYKSKLEYSDRKEFGRRLELRAISVGLGNQAELARLSGSKVRPEYINRIYNHNKSLNWLPEILYQIIYRRGFETEAEVWDLLRLVEPQLKKIRGYDKWMERLKATVAKAFAERPEPETEETGKVLTREQQRKLRIIAEYMDDFRSDGLI